MKSGQVAKCVLSGYELNGHPQVGASLGRFFYQNNN